MKGIETPEDGAAARNTDAVGTLLIHAGNLDTDLYAHYKKEQHVKVSPATDANLLKKSGADWTEGGLKLALSKKASLFKPAERIVILLDGQDCLFQDNRGRDLTPATARAFGHNLLSCEAVTFGRCSFGPAGDFGRNRHVPSLYGFIERGLALRYRDSLDNCKDKVIALIPVQSLLLSRARRQPEQTYGALYIGAQSSSLILANWSLGAVLVRHLPLGVLALVRAVAAETNLPEAKLLNQFAKRDLLAKLKVHQAQPQDDTLAPSPLEAALGPPLTRFCADIRDSLNFFQDEAVCGRLEHLELHGDHAHLKGLDAAWLSANTGLDFRVPEGPSLLEQALLTPADQVINLLDGIETERLESRAAPKVGESGDRRRRAPSDRVRGSADRRRAGRAAAPNWRQRFFGGAKGGDKGAGGGQAGPTIDPDSRTMLALFFLLLIGSLYAGYTQYQTLEKRFNRAYAGYQTAVNTHQELQGDRQEDTLVVTSTEPVDKVLWAEKFLSIAKHLDQHLWLTDIYLTENQQSSKTQTIVSKQLVMEGAALPSSEGHIARIAAYMNRLLDDQDFMGDFNEVSFNGSSLDESEPGNPLVRFKLVAWYDAEKRLSHAGASKSPVTNISGLQDQVQQRDREVEAAFKGNN